MNATIGAVTMYFDDFIVGPQLPFAASSGITTATVSTATNAGATTGTGGFVSGTYTVPAGVSYLRIRMVGGGGGGGGG